MGVALVVLLLMIYRILGIALALSLAPLMLTRSLIRGNGTGTIGQRLGLVKLPGTDNDQPRVWLHAASVGEVQAATKLINEMEDKYPKATFLLSTITEQGMNVARQQLGDKVFCFYAPFDLPFTVRRLLTKLKPDLYICIETELWPNLLIEAQRQGVKLALLNGRMSEGSWTRYKKIKPLIKRTIKCFDQISVITKDDGQRFINLGADPDKVKTLGNAKYSNNKQPDKGEGTKLRKRYLIDIDQPVLILGSTHGNEEEMLLPTQQSLKESFEGLVTIIAPRHLNRLTEVEKLLTGEGIDYSMLSRIEDQKSRHDLILVDSMGHLANLYAMADVIFCGGSLVAKGGHNVMEAAIWGKPVFYGPYMKDFADAAALLEKEDASIPIQSADELTSGIKALLTDPGRYRNLCQKAVIAAQSQLGSARQQIENITHLLPKTGK